MLSSQKEEDEEEMYVYGVECIHEDDIAIKTFMLRTCTIEYKRKNDEFARNWW